jgi:hypothetical protein
MQVTSVRAKSNDPRFNFEATPTIEEIIAQQGKGPIDISVLRKNARPDDEPIEDFLTALREWRGRGKTDPAA